MSGTSVDGIDFSLIETNGNDYVKTISGKSYKYSNKYKLKIKNFIKQIHNNDSLSLKKMNLLVSRLFLYMTNKFINEFSIDTSTIDYIGSSGQTILHNPNKKISIQIGSGKFLSQHLQINVVSDFRQNDIKKGGQGAPIGAFYNHYLSKKLNMKIAFINIGGIANICYSNNNKLIAFDTGPGNVLIDDLIWKRMKKNYDENGNISSKGKLNSIILKNFLNDAYFKKNYPKSLDREYFNNYLEKIKFLSNEDALHTVSMMTVYSIKKGIDLIGKEIDKIILTGGGRKNKFLFNKLQNIIKLKIVNIDDLGINGDLLEAQAFAFITARSIKKLPLSLQTTTGVKKPITGGILYKAN